MGNTIGENTSKTMETAPSSPAMVRTPQLPHWQGQREDTDLLLRSYLRSSEQCWLTCFLPSLTCMNSCECAGNRSHVMGWLQYDVANQDREWQGLDGLLFNWILLSPHWVIQMVHVTRWCLIMMIFLPIRTIFKILTRGKWKIRKDA